MLVWCYYYAKTVSRLSSIWFESSTFCGDGDKYSSEFGGLRDTAPETLYHFTGQYCVIKLNWRVIYLYFKIHGLGIVLKSLLLKMNNSGL